MPQLCACCQARGPLPSTSRRARTVSPSAHTISCDLKAVTSSLLSFWDTNYTFQTFSPHPLSLTRYSLPVLYPPSCSIQDRFGSYLPLRALTSLQLQVLLETQSPSFWLLQVSVLEYPSGPISQPTMSPFTHMSPAQNFKCDFSLKMVDLLLYCDLTLVSDAP